VYRRRRRRRRRRMDGKLPFFRPPVVI